MHSGSVCSDWLQMEPICNPCPLGTMADHAFGLRLLENSCNSPMLVSGSSAASACRYDAASPPAAASAYEFDADVFLRQFVLAGTTALPHSGGTVPASGNCRKSAAEHACGYASGAVRSTKSFPQALIAADCSESRLQVRPRSDVLNIFVPSGGYCRFLRQSALMGTVGRTATCAGMRVQSIHERGCRGSP